MFARVATHEGGSNEKMREMMDQRKAEGDLGLPEGVRRAVALVGENRRLFIAFFDSREALDAAETAFDAMGDDIPEDVRGRRTSVEVYEVVADESM
ncbi:MAG: hypothetical protein PVJ49_13900 [Acidobacteriota bacterium]|jgi:hypothetical protein